MFHVINVMLKLANLGVSTSSIIPELVSLSFDSRISLKVHMTRKISQVKNTLI